MIGLLCLVLAHLNLAFKSKSGNDANMSRFGILALSGHSMTAVKSPLLEGKADIGQPLLTNFDL
jgi:hypothetical protein